LKYSNEVHGETGKAGKLKWSINLTKFGLLLNKPDIKAFAVDMKHFRIWKN
jgi:hypothetical protein